MGSKKILITGSNGLLGQHLVNYYNGSDEEYLATSFGPNRINGIDHNYQSLDITDSDELKAVVESFQPDVIINTAAATNVDGCEDDPDGCDKINHRGVTNFLRCFEELQVNPHFIQISTDFIFNGEKREYLETDKPDPKSVYGLTKCLGEKSIFESGYKNYTIVRTSLVYGVGQALNKGNIFLWAMEKLRNDQELTIVDDQFRSPTYVNDLCKACVSIAESKENGIINIAGEHTKSMFEYIRIVAKFVDKDPDLVRAISTATLKQRAERPKCSGLIIDKAKRLLNFSPTKFEDSLREMDGQ